MVKSVDGGEIPARLVGTHRRLRRADVLAYREQMRTTTDEALRARTDQAQELGLYGADPRMPGADGPTKTQGRETDPASREARRPRRWRALRSVRPRRAAPARVGAAAAADEARLWFRMPQWGLGDETPLAYARTETSAREVEALLNRVDSGVLS